MAERSGPTYSSSTEDRLPWLEPVEDEATEFAVPRSRLVGGVVLALAVIAVFIGGLFWLRQPPRQAASDEIALLPAPAGPYKTRPDKPGGMTIAGSNDTASAAATGAEPNGTIDTKSGPEAPIKAPAATKVATAAAPVKPATVAPTAPVKPAVKPPVQVATKTVPPAIKPATAKPAATTVALPATATKPLGGVSVQLGAFSSQASAEAAWKSLSGKYASLGGLTKNVVAAPKDGGTVYRLRAAGAGAADACSKMKAAGGSCVVIRD
jgi:hypothetical protein